MKKVALAILVVFATGGAWADSVLDMCTVSDKVCSCAAKQLKLDVSDHDYALYETIGAAYINNKSAGMAMGDAWDAAVTAESKQRGSSFIDILNRTNATGRAHNKAMKACSG